MKKNENILFDLTDVTSVRGRFINAEGKTAILQRTGESQGHPYEWELVGGKVKLGETRQGALVREASKELGTPVDYDGPMVEINDRVITDGERYLGRKIVIYCATKEIQVEESEVEIDPKTHLALAWIALNEDFNKYQLTEDTVVIIQHFSQVTTS